MTLTSAVVFAQPVSSPAVNEAPRSDPCSVIRGGAGEPGPDWLLAISRCIDEERDTWKVQALADSLVGRPGTEPVYARLMTHRSASVRVSAYLGVPDTAEGLELLEAAWQRESVAWARAALLRTLNRLGSTVHRTACPGLVDEPEPELALAAIECVGLYGMNGGLERLVAALDARPSFRYYLVRGIHAWAGARRTFGESDRRLMERVWVAAEARWVAEEAEAVRFRDPQVVPPPNRERERLLFALGRTGSPLATSEYGELLSRMETTVTAAAGIAGMGPGAVAVRRRLPGKGPLECRLHPGRAAPSLRVRFRLPQARFRRRYDDGERVWFELFPGYLGETCFIDASLAEAVLYSRRACGGLVRLRDPLRPAAEASGQEGL